jgi:ABC-type branched-subunit amino acid transport system permease subunit
MTISLTILLGPYIGGIGTVLGTTLGAFVVLVVEEFSRHLFVSGHHLFLGTMLVIIMLTMREGIYPTILRYYNKWAFSIKKGPVVSSRT